MADDNPIPARPPSEVLDQIYLRMKALRTEFRSLGRLVMTNYRAFGVSQSAVEASSFAGRETQVPKLMSTSSGEDCPIGFHEQDGICVPDV